MADTYEKDLGQKSSLTTSDFIRVVGSDNVSYKQGLPSVMGAMKVSRTEVANNSDLDTVGYDATLGNAFYRGGNISTMANRPSEETNSFPWALDVINVNGYVKQILHTYTARGNINVYERIQYYSSGSRPFGAWEKHPTRAEIDALNSKIKTTTIAGATDSAGNFVLTGLTTSNAVLATRASNGCTLGAIFSGGEFYVKVVGNTSPLTPLANTSLTMVVIYI